MSFKAVWQRTRWVDVDSVLVYGRDWRYRRTPPLEDVIHWELCVGGFGRSLISDHGHFARNRQHSVPFHIGPHRCEATWTVSQGRAYWDIWWLFRTLARDNVYCRTDEEPWILANSLWQSYITLTRALIYWSFLSDYFTKFLTVLIVEPGHFGSHIRPVFVSHYSRPPSKGSRTDTVKDARFIVSSRSRKKISKLWSVYVIPEIYVILEDGTKSQWNELKYSVTEWGCRLTRCVRGFLPPAIWMIDEFFLISLKHGLAESLVS